MGERALHRIGAPFVALVEAGRAGRAQTVFRWGAPVPHPAPQLRVYRLKPAERLSDKTEAKMAFFRHFFEVLGCFESGKWCPEE